MMRVCFCRTCTYSDVNSNMARLKHSRTSCRAGRPVWYACVQKLTIPPFHQVAFSSRWHNQQFHRLLVGFLSLHRVTGNCSSTYLHIRKRRKSSGRRGAFPIVSNIPVQLDNRYLVFA
jgi:hypothetical protein